MPIIGNLDAANGSDIGIVEITDNSGTDVLALDVQVGGVSKFHVRTKDASIGSKPIIKNIALVTFINPDSDTVALIKDGGNIIFGTSGGAALTRDMVAALGGGVMLGTPTLLPNDDTGNAGLVYAGNNAIVPFDGTITGVTLFIKTAAGSVRAGIYLGDGADGLPGTLLGQSAFIAAVAGWQTFPLTLDAAGAAGNTVVTEGQSIWLATGFDDSGLVEKDGAIGVGTFVGGFSGGLLPNPFGSGSTNGVARSLYARLVP